MSGNFISHDTYPYVFFVRQGEMFFRSNVAEHGCTEPADLGCADG